MSWPRRAPAPELGDPVQVMMTEKEAREFERRYLARGTRLSPPVLFSEDDAPTYIIEVGPDGS